MFSSCPKMSGRFMFSCICSNTRIFIGLALTMVHLVGIGLTGTSVNPARSIGLAVFQPEALGDLWIFIVAPIIGGILAWLVWKKVLCDDDAE